MWVLEDDHSHRADILALEWRATGSRLVAPPLFRVEVTSTLRLKVYTRAVQLDWAEMALQESFLWPVDIWDPGDTLQTRAFNLATIYNLPRAYDAQYLAIGELLGCELWTGDRKLSNAIAGKLPWVRWIGDYRP